MITRHLRHTLCALICALATIPSASALSVFATVPEWGALVEELAGEKVVVYVASSALQDPHRMEARPSLIARARNADLVVATGAELEVGWLPVVLQQSGNSRVQVGAAGHFEAAQFVTLIDKPARLDRADGDVHASGNPHIQTDPRNIARVAEALSQRLSTLDPANGAHYRERHRNFAARWQTALANWEKQAAPLRGIPIVVHHKAFAYLESWLGLEQIAALEPKPGIEPSSAHLAAVLDKLRQRPAKMVIRAPYQSDRASRWVGERTGMAIVVLPFTVGGDASAKDLFSLFGETIQRLLKAAN